MTPDNLTGTNADSINRVGIAGTGGYGKYQRVIYNLTESTNKNSKVLSTIIYST